MWFVLSTIFTSLESKFSAGPFADSVCVVACCKQLSFTQNTFHMYLSLHKPKSITYKIFDWTRYSNLKGLQINVDTILFPAGNLILVFCTTHAAIGVAQRHNTLSHWPHSPFNPSEEFLYTDTRVLKENFPHAFYTSRKFTYFTLNTIQHYLTKIAKRRERTSQARSSLI